MHREKIKEKEKKMQFTYQNPVKIIFGKGKIQELEKEVPADAYVMVIYGTGSIKRNGVYDEVMKALSKHKVVEFSGIEPNPAYEKLMEAVELARREKVDFLLSVGGGSVLDGVKFIAAAIPYKETEDPWDILAKQAEIKCALPIGAVLTLPATGSEMNGISVVSRRSTQEKLLFENPIVMPKFSIMDPTTAKTLPQRQVSNGIVDAFVHVCEQYMVVRKGSALQDRQAEAILQTLIEYAPKRLASNEDEDVLSTIMWCATNALNRLIGVGVPQDWATHMIGHEITAFKNLDHGQTLAIVLPTLLEYKRQLKHDKLLQYAERVWGIHTGTPDERITEAIKKTREFFEITLKVPTRLSAYNISAPELAKAISERFTQRGTRLGEDKSITPQDVNNILLACA